MTLTPLKTIENIVYRRITTTATVMPLLWKLLLSLEKERKDVILYERNKQPRIACKWRTTW
jgi:hypothetical protein